MLRSIFQSGAALLSVAALGAGGTLPAGAAAAAVTPSVFNEPGIPQTGFGSDSVNAELLAMYAEFNGRGQFISGDESISGNIPGSTSDRLQNLYSVAFDKYAISTPTVGSGFESVLSRASGLSSEYQNTDESLYLYSSARDSFDSALASGKNLPSFFTTAVSEFTRVPLPAAAWLLGAGLLGLIAVGRPRRLGLEDFNASRGSSQASHSSAERKPRGKALQARDRNKTSELSWFGAYSCRLLG
jgi:hypothetical protein